MLILSRRKEESIRCVVPPSEKPTVIDLKLIDIKRAAARFGFDAPREVIITRTELLESEIDEETTVEEPVEESTTEAPADAVVT